MNRIAVKLMAIPGLVTALACTDRHLAGPDATALPDASTVPAGVVISHSQIPLTGTSSSVRTPGTVNVSSDAAVAYVSIKPGTYPQAIEADLRNLTANGTALRIGMSDGGFDPVSIAAQPADSLLLQITMADRTKISLTMAVPKRRPPTVVRSDPSKGRTDVALNVVVSVIFSEPLDPKTVTASDVTLRSGGQVVSGVLRVSNEGLTVELVPDKPLDPSTSYDLAVATEIRDLDGNALDESYDATFLTAASSRVAARLEFDYPPPNAIAGSRLSYSVNVRLSNSPGTGTVTLTIGKNPGAGVLSGTTTSSAFSGVAEFQDLRIDRPGSGYTLVASVTGVPSAESAPFDVGPAIGPTTRLITFWSSEDNLSVVDLDSRGVARLGKPGQWGIGMLAWSPDGSRIAFPYYTGGDDLNEHFDIAVMNADGSGFTSLTNNPSDVFFTPAWSRDGSKIMFWGSRAGSNGIWVMNRDGTGLTQLTSGEEYEVPVWSPDGAHIAFTSTRDGRYQVYVVNADGSGISRLTNDSADDIPLDWSPDGSRIAFESNRAGNWDYYLMNTDGSGVSRLSTVLASSPSPCGCFRWSPDGTKVVVGVLPYLPGYPDSYVMSADGSGLTKLNTGQVKILGPQWSPDGTAIYATGLPTDSGNSGNFEWQVYVMNSDGSGITAVTPFVRDTNIAGYNLFGGASANAGQPAWRPRP